jgi:pilus assembly protein Flp/PilA
MTNVFVRFAKNESGAAAIEYGLIVAAISVAILTIVFSIGSHQSATLKTITAMFPGQTAFTQ